MNRKLSLTALIVLDLLSCASRQKAIAPQASPPVLSTALAGETYRVKRVADGDTITVVDRQNRDIKQYGSVKARKLISDLKFRSVYSLSSTSVLRLFRAKL